MINYLDLQRRLRGRSLGNLAPPLPLSVVDSMMPTVYQFATPGGRPYQDDHTFFNGERRMDHSYRLPMPAFKICGNAEPMWTPHQADYPLAPGTEVRMMPWWDGARSVDLPHILTMHPSYGPGKWAEIGVYLDGQIRPCYLTWSTDVMKWGPWKGKYFYHNRGLKPDVNAKPDFAGVGDTMWAWPEASGPMLKTP